MAFNSYRYSGASSGLTEAIKTLLIINAGVYLLQIIPGSGDYLIKYFSLIPSSGIAEFQVWRFLTYAFLHDPISPLHILFNMLALWMFGTEIEEMWGKRKFYSFYMISAVGSGLFSIFLWDTVIIGASGAVLSLLTVYAFYFPKRRVLMFFIFPVPVYVAVILIGGLSIVFASSGHGTGGGIAHLTHLGGIVVGALYLKLPEWIRRARHYMLEIKAEKDYRAKVEHRIERKKFYDEEVDPVLKKISEKGMESLTPEEKKILEKASSGSNKIISVDFKKKNIV